MIETRAGGIRCGEGPVERLFGWGKDPQIQIRIQETREILARLEEGVEVQACRAWLATAERTFQERTFGFLPYRAYDVIWAAFNQIRHLLCRILPEKDLLAVALNVRASLAYVAQEEQRRQCLEALAPVEAFLRRRAAGQEADPSHSFSAEEARYVLERLSRIAADAREAHWRKVNLLRMRLLVTAFLLVALLVGSLWLVPAFLPLPEVTWKRVLAVVVLGALGGFVSALRTMEALDVSASAYYIQRTLLGVRPVIGAAAGLFVYLLQLSGIVSMVPAGSDAQAVHLVLAFAAGFSERFFVAQVERVASPGKARGRAPARPPGKKEGEPPDS